MKFILLKLKKNKRWYKELSGAKKSLMKNKGNYLESLWAEDLPNGRLKSNKTIRRKIKSIFKL
jgi:hypothetical protein